MSKTLIMITAAALSLEPMALAQDAAKSASKRAPATRASVEDAGVQQAVQFERTKAREDALQVQKERQHPIVRPNYNANRRAENGSTVHDPGSLQWQKDNKKKR